MHTGVFFIESLGELYLDVQTNKIFPDSKYFVDCIPRLAPAEILALYQQEKNTAGFDLKQFVTKNFVFPIDFVSLYHSDNKPILQHLHELWPELTRKPENVTGGTLIPLPHPYVVPGGRFREVYYWDSYFTLLGLQVSKQTDTIQHMVDNFAWLIDNFGFVPNGNRTYYLSRSQPPFFTLMVELLAEQLGERALTTYLPSIEKEYAFWMQRAKEQDTAVTVDRYTVTLDEGVLLNRYWDEKDSARPEAFREDSAVAAKASGNTALVHTHLRAACASGWDFSSRWLRDGKTMATIEAAHIIPVDLNCLLYHMEAVLSRIYALKGDTEMADSFQSKVASRKRAIDIYCWNEEKGFYFDYQFMDKQQTPHFTLAAASPLFFGLASPQQASAVAAILESKFLQAGGLATTLLNTGQQWDFPNGWAPLQWIAYSGLKKYGHTALANEIKRRWMAANEQVYAKTGKLMEKYNVTEAVVNAKGGEYPNQDGFGWTNGVYLKMSADQD